MISKNFTSNSFIKLDVFRHDGHSFDMYGTQIDIPKRKTNEINFSCFLESINNAALQTLRYCFHQSLEWNFPDQCFRALLIISYLSLRKACDESREGVFVHSFDRRQTTTVIYNRATVVTMRPDFFISFCLSRNRTKAKFESI